LHGGKLLFAKCRSKRRNQIGLGRKVTVHGPGRDPRAVGDRDDLYGADPFFRSDVRSGREYCLPAGGELAERVFRSPIDHELRGW
jgi:hypothetical protein